MTDADGTGRRASDVGRESPGEAEARSQRRAGERGGPREAKPPGRTTKQPAQTSGRRAARHEPAPKLRKHFDDAERPSAQRDAEGESSADSVRRRPSQQGIGAKSGSHGADSERVEQEARKGPPHDEHAGRGRQHVSSDRPGQGRRDRGGGR
ncbi:MAG: hypothetical protein ACODAE_03890 [Gemmatimonadota bacterium]